MQIGKLYRFNGEFVTDVSYQLHGQAPTNLWGELIPMEHVGISDGGDYTLELEGNRKSRCHLKKRVNRAVSGIPPRYVYHFAGAGTPN